MRRVVSPFRSRPPAPRRERWKTALALMAIAMQSPAPVLKGADGGSFRNSLGMEFRAVRETAVRFSTWETRVADWNAYLKASGRVWNHLPAFPQDDSHPVVNVTLADALAFCDWLTQAEQGSGRISPGQTYRLPTNHEWDAAARVRPRTEGARAVETAGAGPFPWGRDWPPHGVANVMTSRIAGAEDDGFRFTAPVGRFPGSEDGLHDLAGNVWEWTHEDTAGGSASALRGGSWMHWRQDQLAAAFRLTLKETTRSPGVGFRCVLSEAGTASDPVSRSVPFGEKPHVSEADRRALMAQRGGVAATTAAAAVAPTADKPFENSLNLKLLPVPGHRVLLGEHEVRMADFRRFVLASDPGRAADEGWRRNPDHPATGISWADARAFCAWLTERERSAGTIPPRAAYRLPRAAEWRAAAGGDAGLPFPWGPAWPPPNGAANLQSAGTTPVKTHSANAHGFHDLAGNAAEWCEDAERDDRLVVGGSWQSRAREDFLTAAASPTPPDTRSPEIGFRIVLDLAPEGGDPR